eukprot:maker-scaffold320_size207635-snap-gene-1.16 protein:Tk09313 transcript:maker-scaffold320_size207635-snap-gene-1.16-mRNA-1 annotation:"PREDICTED: uncharacterized protein LOC100870258"
MFQRMVGEGPGLWTRLMLAALVYLMGPLGHAHPDCRLPQTWSGRWFHLGFSSPLKITEREIENKGACFQQNVIKNMYLMQESPTVGRTCFRCMMIFEKHFNVLQYKE